MENDLKDMFKKIKLEFTDEYFKDLSEKCYKRDREYPENFSNWYPHIKNFGTFNHAEIISNQIFTLDETEIMREEDVIDKVDWNKWRKILKPTLDKMKPGKLYNIKNGCFSNKFDFNTCIATKDNLAEQLWKINYVSTMYDTGGYTELVVREYIPYDHLNMVTIYNGMPLREEVRVFYNMDEKKIEYMVDYWDYNYCRNSLNSKTDKIIFDWFHKETNHQSKLEMVRTIITENINTLKFDKTLTGIWSIDFMYIEETHEIYLIDMARGFRSAFYDKNLIGVKEN